MSPVQNKDELKSFVEERKNNHEEEKPLLTDRNIMDEEDQ